VRQAGSYVGPDKLRFDFAHGQRLSDEELADVEARVNGWVADNLPVRAIETSLDEAKAMGAMALFGEKYGDWVRMVEIDEVSRELCGGTHVRSTGEVGLFHVTTEASSASNVRRIEALTGAAATDLFEERTARLRELSKLMKAPEGELVRAAERLGSQVKELKKKPASSAADDGAEAERLVGAVEEVEGAKLVAEQAQTSDQKALLGLSDRVRQKLGESAVVLAMDAGGKLALVANVAPELVARGVKAGEIVRAAAEVAGGGGGGRDNVAQAGGGDPAKAEPALAAARAAIEEALRS
jgi:alanyl-tRNA synthetase